MAENVADTMRFSGVNLITGPSNAGKTLLCEAIKWALTGAPGLRHPRAVSVGFDGVGVLRTEVPDGRGSRAVVSVGGREAADPEAALREIGANPAFYVTGVGGLFNSNCPESEPPTVIESDKHMVDLSRCSLEKCRSALHELLAERETLTAIAAGIEAKSPMLQAEIDALLLAIAEMKKVELAQLDLSALHVMDSGECPVYPLSCPCTDSLVQLTKEHYRKRTEGVELIPDFIRILGEKQRELAEKRLRLQILSEGMPDVGGKKLQERLAEVETRIALGEKVVEGRERLSAWEENRKKAEPFIGVKDRLIALAAELGLPLGFDGRAYVLRGAPPERGSRTDLVLLGYCLQAAADVPLAIVDDFDILDKNWKARLISHATGSGKPALLFASSSGPIRVPGVASWHLNGRLEKVG